MPFDIPILARAGANLRQRTPLSLVSSGNASSRLASIRSQLTGVESAVVGSDGTTLQLFGADALRFEGASRWLLIEGQRTNAHANMRLEGATLGVLGSGGVVPTSLAAPSTAAGVTVEVYAVGTTDNINWVEFAFSGTTTATWGPVFVLQNNANATASLGQTWTASLWFRVTSGTWPTPNIYIGITEYAGASQVATQNSGTFISSASSWSRRTMTATTAQATVNNVRARLWGNANVASGVAVNFRIRIGWPQLELGPFASTPILPPVGSPAASTRGADLISATLASLGIGANGACTVLWSGMMPQAAPASASQAIAEISDGTSNNRYIVNNGAGGAGVNITRINGGASSASSNAGTYTAGTPFAIGAAIDAAGRAALTFNGGAIQAVTGGPTSGLTTLRLGNTVVGASPLFGETARLSILPYALSDAALQAAVAAFPTN